MRPFLVVSAFGPELAPFKPNSKGQVIHDAMRFETQAQALGVGPIDAAVGAARAIARLEPSFVVFSGTCGVYPGAAPRVGEIVVASALHFGDGASALGLAAIPAIVRRRLEPAAAWLTPFERAGARSVELLTLAAITTDAELATALARQSACEHLEAFAVASACEAAGVPWACVLGIANVVGPDARAEWLRNHHEASRLAAAVVLAGLAELDASGVPSGRA
jgi:nucleoside phosphorylase